MTARRRGDDGPHLHEYITALYKLGYEVEFTQAFIADTPTRPAQFLRTIYLKREGRIIHENSGFSYARLLTEALELVRHKLLE
jgi:P2-related tail formation protein